MIDVVDSAVVVGKGALRAMLLGKVKVACAALLVMVAVATALAQTGTRPEVPGQSPLGTPRGAHPSVPGRPPVTADGRLPQHALARLGTTPPRHQSFVTRVIYAPDARTLASARWGRTGRV